MVNCAMKNKGAHGHKNTLNGIFKNWGRVEKDGALNWDIMDPCMMKYNVNCFNKGYSPN